jgi:hypothetical protein
MSDISSGSIDINLHTGDDGSGRGPDGDMKVVIETLRNVQNSVATISQNVRAILETLRVIARGASRGGSGGGRGSGGDGGGGGSGGGPRPSSGGGGGGMFAADILEYRNRMSRTMGLRITDIATEQHKALLSRYHTERENLKPAELREALGLRRLEIYGEEQQGRMTAETAQAMYRAEAAKAKEQIRAQKEAQREAARQARTAAQETARQAKADLQSARNRMGGYQNARISELRRRAGLPGADVASLGLTEEERALVSGEASPSGLPGTRAYATNVRGIVSSVSEPEESNRQPNQERGSNIFRSIGRVLATLSLIGSSIKTVISMIKFFPDLARQQRSELARVDPVIAQYQAQSMIANLQDRIIMGRDPSMRAAYAGFTQSEMGYLQNTRTIRMQGRRLAADLGQTTNEFLGGLGLAYEGLLEGDFSKIVLGIGSFEPFIGSATYRAYTAMKLAQQGNTLRSIFIGDLVGMTGGRFSTNIAYPGRRDGEAWWNARP